MPHAMRKLSFILFTGLIIALINLPSPSQASVASDLKTWQALMDEGRADTVSFAAVQDFMTRNHNWPSRSTIQKRFERRLSGQGQYSLTSILLYFSQHPPLTAQGWEVYLTALDRKGQRYRGEALFREWWYKTLLAPHDQRRLIERYGTILTRKDHAKRLERILYDKGYTAARELAQLLGKGYPALVEARIALQNDKNGLQRLVDAVPAVLQNNKGLVYDRIVWRRQNNNEAGAIELLMNSPNIEDEDIAKKWWRQRHILARDLLEEKRYVQAYDLLNQHKQKEALGFSQAEWLKGWLALRFLGRPHQAFQAFEGMFNAVSSPISRARGAYWAGRAAQRLGQKDVSKLWYQAAAQYPTTYYGQTAAVKLGLRDNLNRVVEGRQRSYAQSQADFASLYGDGRAQAAMILARQGDRKTAGIFINRILYDIDNANQLHFFEPLAALAEKLKLRNTAIRIAKKAERHGIFLSDSSYPVVMDLIARSNPLDPALIHAIIRQESRFDELARSHAGALGLMQLMPATAKETAGKLGIAHNRSWLTSRPQHNIVLGSSYLDRMLKRFDGNMPMAIASYNAGPGRVDQWIRRFGDPRQRNVDMMDWMETIPIYETRNYVQRVLESYAVYQVKLAAYRPAKPNAQRYNQ